MNEAIRTAGARAAFDLVDDGVLVIAVDGQAGHHVVTANEAVARMTGYDRDAIVGRHLADLQSPRVVAGLARRVEEVVRSGLVERAQVVEEGPAGRVTLDVSLISLPEFGDDPPHVVAVLRDVTALMRLDDVLSEVERVTRTGTWTWDVAGDVVRWSSQLYELFGVNRTDLQPSFTGYLDRIHPDDRDDVEAAINRTFETGEPFVVDHRVVTPAREVRWLHCTGRRFSDLDGRPVRLSGTAQFVRTGDQQA